MILNRFAKRSKKRGFATSIMPNPWQDSTYAEAAWGRSRSASVRWAVAGGVLGLLVGLVMFAPAQWLAQAVARATDQRVLLSDARGTLWSGSAVVILTGGADSRDASALPGRIDWTLGLQGTQLALAARHACCLNGTVNLRIRPGFTQSSVTLLPKPDGVGQWPSALLSGLGTPWNTLALGGNLRMTSSGFTLQWTQGRVQFEGSADIDLANASSRLVTLDTLGSYRVNISSDPAQAGQPPQLRLTTTEGALNLTGSGTITPKGVRFRGEASSATPQSATALSNLLNIIGRREGAKSVISIG
jgi:general secretion pathway protein N